MLNESPQGMLSSTAQPAGPLKIVVLVVLAIVALWLGVSWLYAWPPFEPRLSEKELMLRKDFADANAPGVPTEVPPEVLKDANAPGTSTPVSADVLEAANAPGSPN